jgi:hypothetical protein
MAVPTRAWLSVAFALVLAAGAAHSGSRRDEDSAGMAKAAQQFLEGLDKDQRAKAVLAFDSPQRLDWHFIPRKRAGLAIGELAPSDRAHLDALLASALSLSGREKFAGVLRLEAELRKLESKPGSPADWRDPGLYFVAVFGVPGVEPWGWRLEGHHWSANFSALAGGAVTVTPNFIGAHPARLGESGLELLGPEDQRARAFAAALRQEQLARAKLAGSTPNDVLLGPSRAKLDGKMLGIAATELDAAQRALLVAIVEGTFSDLSAELAGRERARFSKFGADSLHFAWAGDPTTGVPWYWRVQNAQFAIEFVYPQNDISHAHRVWRDFERDFGANALQEHLRLER